MIRAARLAPSRPMYAFKPETWRPANQYWFRVDAAWFRRKKGVLHASMGTYDPMVIGRFNSPTTGAYEDWIAAADDNRYGGDHLASWDGEALLCSDQPVSPEEAAQRVEFLSAMLKGFPDPPAGYDGWWTFPRGDAR